MLRAVLGESALFSSLEEAAAVVGLAPHGVAAHSAPARNKEGWVWQGGHHVGEQVPGRKAFLILRGW